MNKILVLFGFWLTVISTAVAQTKVSGMVVDNTNQPVPYANIVFKGSQIGVVSNEDGRFYIEAPDNDTTLVVSDVGFPDKIVKLTKLGKLRLQSGIDRRECPKRSKDIRRKNIQEKQSSTRHP